jgi:GTPase
MFVDQIKIHAKAGDGGNGCVSFRREKFVPRGGPNGGDGGRGGDIILRVDPNVDNLAAFFYEPIVRAKHGEHGQGKNCYGRAAKPKIVPVPPGTLVYRVEGRAGAGDERSVERAGGVQFVDLESSAQPRRRTPAAPSPTSLIADLTVPGDEFVLCKGGRGGKGNVHFKSSTNRVPREATPGEEGEEGDFFLELRKIADAGLVGYPNAGKSTLLGKISAAHPKVAPYPFTTLHPIIGVVDFPGYARATVADIPGLIEGAHRGVGLGDEFLRHIVRCKLLLFVIDMAGSEGRSPIDDLAKLREELKRYDPQLTWRPWIVVANKMDLPEANENLRAFKARYRRRKVVAISADTGAGLDELKAELARLLFEPAEA